jgi:Mannose-6-phosphate receptor
MCDVIILIIKLHVVLLASNSRSLQCVPDDWIILEYEGGDPFHNHCTKENRRAVIMIMCKKGETVVGHCTMLPFVASMLTVQDSLSISRLLITCQPHIFCTFFNCFCIDLNEFLYLLSSNCLVTVFTALISRCLFYVGFNS